MKPARYRNWWIGTILIGVIGLRRLVSGIRWRNYAETRCSTCNQLVIAKKRQFGLLCPNADQTHYARRYYGEMIALFILGLLAACAIAVAFIFRGSWHPDL